ncbi:glycosyltransferase family 25 protein [Campylobacter sp. MG1]|uniref:glycosyltransferase family 25 protein n=1 Tax=Campylobacter sp. MG1 TaxID=2976332 RepID=UPI00226C6B9C|nr:glycosyltransferase family 25 protein [Campylobacter sp. MG1]
MVGGGNNEFVKFKKYYENSLFTYILGRALTDCERACFASHFLLWQKCIEENEPIIVLEDDLKFSDEFNENTLNLILNSKYDYVRLYKLFDKKIYKINNNFYKTYKKLSGAQAYLLKPNAAKKFIKYARYWVYPVDDYMDTFGLHGVLTILYQPLLVSENYSESTILHKDYNVLVVKKITREIFKSLIFIRTLFFRLFYKY